MPSTPADTTTPCWKLDRVVVVGTCGAGKTTFAGQLAARLACPHVELDSLYWLGDWVPREASEFAQIVNQAIAGPRWVVDGNYSAVRELVWSKATAIIWLDYRFPLVFWRALRRTVTRIVTRESACNGNRETIRRAFLSRYGVPWWVVRTYRRRTRAYPALLAAAQQADLRVIVMKRPDDARRFLDSLPMAIRPPRD